METLPEGNSGVYGNFMGNMHGTYDIICWFIGKMIVHMFVYQMVNLKCDFRRENRYAVLAPNISDKLLWMVINMCILP